MKRRNLIICILAIITFISIPNKVNAVTLKQYEDDVAKYQAQINEKKSALAKNNETLSSVQNRLKEIQSNIVANEKEQERLQAEIDKSNEEIKKKTEQSKKLVEYYQISNGENTYLEYIFGAKTITDMINRISVVEQLADYNDKIMKELKKLVAENKKNQESLSKKQEELKSLQNELIDEQKKLQQSSKTISESIPNIENDLKNAQERVAYYKAKGCSSNDTIGVTCDVPQQVSSGSSSSAGVVIGANGFTSPLPGIRISNDYGNAYYPYPHKGLDYSAACGTRIRATAAGRVYYVGSTLDSYGAKMILMVHNVNGRLVFSQYAHLQGYAVSSGDNVSAGQVIGYVGSTGWSTGCHLHFEMTEDYGWNYNASYYTYIAHRVNPHKYIG